jgi:hypothetical protein
VNRDILWAVFMTCFDKLMAKCRDMLRDLGADTEDEDEE